MNKLLFDLLGQWIKAGQVSWPYKLVLHKHTFLKSIVQLLRWRLPGSRGFEAITNEAICQATKIHLLHHVISVYVIIKMAAAHTKAHCLVTRRNLLLQWILSYPNSFVLIVCQKCSDK